MVHNMALRTMLAKHPKTGMYLFRKRVPKHLVNVFGKREFKGSLAEGEKKYQQPMAWFGEVKDSQNLWEYANERWEGWIQ